MLKYKIPIATIDKSDVNTFGYFFFIEVSWKKPKTRKSNGGRFSDLINKIPASKLESETFLFPSIKLSYIKAQNDNLDIANQDFYPRTELNSFKEAPTNLVLPYVEPVFYQQELKPPLDGKARKFQAFDSVFLLGPKELEYLEMNGATHILISGAKIHIGHVENATEEQLPKPDWFTLMAESVKVDKSKDNRNPNATGVIPQVILMTPCPPLWKPELDADEEQLKQILESVTGIDTGNANVIASER